MSGSSIGRLNVLFPRLAAVASVLCIALGVVGIVGWVFDIASLRSIWPGLATMKFNNALCFVATGFALLLQTMAPTRAMARPRLATFAAVFSTTLGLLTLAQDSFGVSLGIDQLLMRDRFTDPALAAPGRMSPITALNHALLGIAVLTLRNNRCPWVSTTLAALALLSAFVAVLGYTFDASSMYAYAPFRTVALHTAVGFVVLSLGVMLSDVDGGISALLVSDSPGGSMFRCLLPIAALLPLLISWTIFRLYQDETFGPGFTLAVSTALETASLVGVVWWIAGVLHRQDTARRATEEQIRRQAEREHLLLQELDHRVNNNLMALQAVIDISGRSAVSTEELTQALRARIGAVARAHHLLSQARWSPLSLQQVITALIPPGFGHAMTIAGDEVVIDPRRVNAAAMVVQELLTNSLKHGALRTSTGRVEVRCERHSSGEQATPIYEVRWREHGGPAITTEPKPGLGTMLMKELVRLELNGSLQIAYPSDGASHCLRMPGRPAS